MNTIEDSVIDNSDWASLGVSPATVRSAKHVVSVGQWFIDKYRAQAQKKGFFQTALNLKRQGVPFDIAKQILNIR